MTRQEAIERWKGVVMAVFRAEDTIGNEWHRKLNEAKKMPKEDKEVVCDDYLTAIATEILSKTTDEELKEME